MSEKSILEQALLQVQTLEEAVKANAKGILASTMKQELNELLKESKKEEEEKDVEEQPDPNEEEPKDTSDEDSTEDDEEDTSDEIPADDEMGSPDDEMGSPDDEMGSPDDEMGSPDDTMDLTSSSDEDVLRVFKKMKPEDGIIVKKDGDDLDIEIDDNNYIIKLDEEIEDSMNSMEEDEWNEEELNSMEEGEWNEEELNSTEETVYEIELDEEKDEEPKEEEMKEAARTKWNPHGNKGGSNRSGIPSKKVFKAGSGVTGINEEFKKLKKQNSEYKKALVLFKDKLNEVAVFNANLAYATRLFTEHSTTKQEKLNILKRFDSVSNMNESKNLFNIIKTELETKKPVTESVVDKITSNPSSSSSKVLSESKAYENPQFKRMKDLMGKLK